MKRIRLTESDLHRIVKESVKNVLKETIQGGSSANGTAYNYSTGERTRNQGGKFGGNDLDRLEAERYAERNRQAQSYENSQKKYKDWCYANYDYVMQVCPGYMNSGEYEKAYRMCN